VNTYSVCHNKTLVNLDQKCQTHSPGADPGISGGGDDMDEEKIGRGLGAAVGPQRGPGAEPLVGVKGAKPPIKVALFHELYSDFALSK
jgi:hypothetical protein